MRLALTLAAGLLGSSGAFAATFGHARIASPQGEPLVIRVPVSGLSDADVQALAAGPAAAEDWAQAGLTPPVALDSLRIAVEPGVRPEGRVLRVSSPQPFSGPVADLLLDVRTASGSQRYQVSLLTGAHAPAPAPAAGGAAAPAGGAAVGAAPHTSGARVPAGAIHVRRGDTMFAIARRHAVDGVTVYQLMMALQRANPQAFIQRNVNLVKAGAQLVVPGMDELLAISDREARRQFQVQAAAFAAMRGRMAGAVAAAPAQAEGAAGQGRVSEAAPSAEAAPAAGRGDHLQLSDAQGARKDAAADARTSRQLESADRQARIGQLEDNVQHLNEALKGQGEAARNAVIDGAKGIGDSIASVAQAIVDAGKAEEADAAMRQSAADPRQAGGAGAGGPGGSNAATGAAAGGASGSGAANGAAAGGPGGSIGANGAAAAGSGGSAGANGAGTSGSGGPSGTNGASSGAAGASGSSGANGANGAAAGGASGAAAAAAAGMGAGAGAPGGAAAGGSNGVAGSSGAAGAGSPGASGAGGSNGSAGAGAGGPSGAAGANGAAAAGAGGSGANGSGAGGASAGGSGTGGSASAGATGSAPQGSAGSPAATGSQGAAGSANGASANPLEAVASPEAAARAAQTEAEAAQRSQGVVDWLQEHLLVTMTGLLALIVFIIAWLLRRAGSARDETYDAALATEAKVRETLKDIDLELKPRQDEPSARG